MDEALLVERLRAARWQEIIILDEVESTNGYALQLLAEGTLRDGAVIIANRQTAGRGRFKRAWFSDGGLALTVTVISPEPPHRVGPVTLNAGVAVAKGLKNATGRDFYLKYPNDVMSEKEHGKKIAGILVEMKPAQGGTALIVGIGVNVEQERFPDEIAPMASSLRQLGCGTRREVAAAEILNALEADLERPFCDLREEWLNMDCTIGRPVRIKNLKADVEGIAAGLDGDGALLVNTARGTERITAGDVIFGE
ncbi:MAG: biotin--[acetyl-CoA-carboxylase] ligase [Nitrospinae bacterium]|nr:biotin--[acetyl-CoA-carboxylase] ligase [Nitrospinota bacterium]